MTNAAIWAGGRAGAIRPLLTTFAVPRSGSDELPGHYSWEHQVWVVETPDGEMPVIEACGSMLDLLTKTRAQQEADDHRQSLLLDTITKTAAQMESDDNRTGLGTLLELATKTEAQIERDDS